MPQIQGADLRPIAMDGGSAANPGSRFAALEPTPGQIVLESAQYGAQLLDEPVELGALDDQRRREANDLLVRVLGQNTALE